MIFPLMMVIRHLLWMLIGGPENTATSASKPGASRPTRLPSPTISAALLVMAASATPSGSPSAAASVAMVRSKGARVGVWILECDEDLIDACERFKPDLVETTGKLKPDA